jgi:hypothetical protein
MAFGIAADADLADAAFLEQAVLQNLEAVVVRAFGARLVAADEEHPVNAVLRRGVFQEFAKFFGVADTSRGHMRYGVESGTADRGHGIERAGERQPRQGRNVDAGVGRQHRRNFPRAMQLARRDLERAPDQELGQPRLEVGLSRACGK